MLGTYTVNCVTFLALTMLFRKDVFMCASVHMTAGACEGQTGPLAPLQLELQPVVTCLRWVLGTELRSPRKAVTTKTTLSIFLTTSVGTSDGRMGLSDAQRKVDDKGEGCVHPLSTPKSREGIRVP